MKLPPLFYWHAGCKYSSDAAMPEDTPGSGLIHEPRNMQDRATDNNL
jgi:hypothetical protein